MYIALNNRGLIKIEGPDARDFLQGLISQDINRVSPERAVYSAFLTPQGKFLYDFFCFEMAGALMLDCEADRRSDFFKRLSMYKLRSDATLTDVTSDFQVFALPDDTGERGRTEAMGGGVAFVDPRLGALGTRCVLPQGETPPGEAGKLEDYERKRISLGVADGSRDMAADKALLLENGFEELDGVSFDKGCFMGQELTARTRYRGLVKKRLLPVSIDGPAPEAGTPLMAGDREAGEMRTSSGDIGLALIRLDQLQDGVTFKAGDATVSPSVPDWVVFQDQGKD